MDEDDGVDRPSVLVSSRLAEVTEPLSAGAEGLLIKLIRMAAEARSTEIPVSAANVAPYIPDAEDREAFPARFSELKLRGLVQEMRPGVYAIAPGLLKVGVWDPDNKEFFPYN